MGSDGILRQNGERDEPQAAAAEHWSIVTIGCFGVLGRSAGATPAGEIGNAGSREDSAHASFFCLCSRRLGA